MSTTLSEITTFLDQIGLKYTLPEAEANLILIGFHTDRYVDTEGKRHLRVTVRVDEEGEFVGLDVPWGYVCPADHPHHAAVLETAMRVNWISKTVTWRYDEDGELRASCRLILEDAPLTRRQFERCLHNLVGGVDDCDTTFRRALDHGQATDPRADLSDYPDLPPAATAPVPPARRRPAKTPEAAAVGLEE